MVQNMDKSHWSIDWATKESVSCLLGSYEWDFRMGKGAQDLEQTANFIIGQMVKWAGRAVDWEM